MPSVKSLATCVRLTRQPACGGRHQALANGRLGNRLLMAYTERCLDRSHSQNRFRAMIPPICPWGFRIVRHGPYDAGQLQSRGFAASRPHRAKMKRLTSRVAAQMTRIFVLALGLLIVASTSHAQDPPPLQSLKPTPNACTIGSQSLRVCRSGLQSCNDVCAARALSANSEIVGCTTACCNRYNVCVQGRNCRAFRLDCGGFSFR